MPRIQLLAIPFTIMVAACGPKVSSGNFSSQPLPPTTGEIMLFSTKQPACEYDEIGLVNVKRAHGFNSMQSLIDALRERARQMGGHAVLGVSLAARVESSGEGDVSTDRDLTGTVIRFKMADCRR
jgi:hypothetical protein